MPYLAPMVDSADFNLLLTFKTILITLDKINKQTNKEQTKPLK